MKIIEWLRRIKKMKKVTILPLILGIIFASYGSAGAAEKLATTREQIQLIGSAVEAYTADHDKVPEVFSIKGLATLLEPRYINHCPLNDAWGNKLHYAARNVQTGKGQKYSEYWIGSSGASGEFEGFLKHMTNTASNDNTNNIIYSNGEFKDKTY
jgi:type II secretory pathway pseudopilin PulG